MKRTPCLGFMLSCFLVLSVCSPLFVNGQTGEYKVWVRTSPCVGRFDWISVAKENPTGGLNFYYAANVIFPGTACTMLGCTFDEATKVAASLRSSDEFFKYCCREYSVWENPQTGKKSVVVGKFGTAGPPWQFVKGDLCCEEAEALAGITGACSGSTGNHDDEVRKTKCWPGSYPFWNEQTHRVECNCLPGKVWNDTKTACIDPVSQVKCWPGSYAATNPQTNKIECYCNPGLVWNDTKAACIEPVSQVKCWPGSYAATNPQTNKIECYCNPGLVWNDTKTACIEPVSQVKCWPGSYAATNPQTNKIECYCNPGLVWNDTKTACIEPVSQVKCWPGSYAATNPQTNKIECYCNPGLVWNDTKTACIEPVSQVKCWPGSYAATNPQTNKIECYCNPGLVWNDTKTACIEPVSQVKCWPGSYAATNPQTNKIECYCNPGLVWNETKTACVDKGGITTTGSPTWTLVSMSSAPTTPGQGWTFSAQGGTAHWDIYNGDKADFQWTPPPQQITSNGFTITISTKSNPAPNSRLAALIGLGGYGFTTDSPTDQGALANAPDGQPSAQRTMKFIPSATATEIEVRIELMWGDVKFYYKYKRM